MTEYGVLTNNIFDLLNTADEAAKPAAPAKPKTRKKKSQRGKGGAASGQPQAQTGQVAKPAGQPPKKEQTSQPAAQPRAAAVGQQPRAAVTVGGGRGNPPRTQGNASVPGGGRGNNQGGRGGPNQGTRPQAPRQALARGTEEFVRRHDDSHVSFAEDRPKPDTGRHEGAPRQTGPARGREFDRHAGTGRSPVENKRGGGGQGNWGKLSEEDELAGGQDAKAEIAADSPEARKEENKNKKKKKKAKKGEEEKGEEEKSDELRDDQLKTFDDFLKEKASKAVKMALPPARVAGEGVKADPKWAEAVKREDTEEVFLKAKEEPKKETEADSKPTKAALRKKRKKEAKEQAAKKLSEQNITNMFDFSAKKENDYPRGGRGRGGPRGPPRDGGNRGSREGGNRGSREGGPRDGGNRGSREGGNRGSREGGNRGGAGGSGRGNQQPRKYKPTDSEGARFDDSAFPALHVGPPPITVD